MKSSSHTIVRILALAGALALGVSATAYTGTIDLIQNDVNWGKNYYAPSSSGGSGKDGLPTDSGATSPLWAPNGGATAGSLSLEPGYLEVDTAASGDSYWFQTAFGSVSSTSGTLEWTAQVTSTTSLYAGGIYAGFGSYVWSLQFGSNPAYALQWGGQNYTKADLGGVEFSEMTTFRIVMEDMTDASATATLYLNNDPTPVITLDSSKMGAAWTQSILFGQTADRANQAGVVDWEGIRWRPDAAIMPIPEPTHLAFASLGLLLAGRVFRRRRNA